MITKSQKIAITGFNNLYVTAELNSNGELIANKSWLKDWEQFSLLQLNNGKFAFKAFNGKICYNRIKSKM
jgi:hypothetical protein